MAIDLYQLRAFFTLVQKNSFSETAKKLFVTQSAISHALKKLENSIDHKLIIRRAGKLHLTNEGKMLYKSCENIFYELEKIEEFLKVKSNYLGEVRLGATIEFGSTVLIRHIKSFIKNNPDVHVDFQLKHDLLAPLLSDDVDLIIDCKKHNLPILEKIKLFREQYVVIASPSYLNKNVIRKPLELEKSNILSLDKEYKWWSNFMYALPKIKRPKFNKVIEINHVRGIINAAVESIGVGFVPKYCVLKELKSKALVNVFPRLRLMEDQFCIYVKKTKASLEKNRILIEFLKNIKPSEFGDIR